MKTMLVTAFDEEFYEYGQRMLRSFRHFNRHTAIGVCDVGLSEDKWAELETLGVRRLRREGDRIPSLRTNMDMLVWEFVANIEWESILVADADMLFLRNVDHLFALTRHFRIVIAPDRGREGPETVWEGIPRVSFCLWATADKAMVEELYRAVAIDSESEEENRTGSRLLASCPQDVLCLDGDLYNWGRDAIADAQMENGEIFHVVDGRRVYPYVAHFARLDDGSRLASAALDRFYAGEVLGRRHGGAA